MKRTITVFGLVSGLVLAFFLAVLTITFRSKGEHGSMVMSMYFGYAMMLAAFSVIFVAIKNYRDRYLNGNISFGKALQIGLGISLIASICYVIMWMILYKTVVPDFMDKYISMELLQLRKAGKPEAEVQQHAAEMEHMRTLYNTWYGCAGFTFMEIFPVGLVVSLIAAAIMRRRKKQVQVA